ncbi:hypothetical protein DPMN_184598 [Dreissena polymorpha]|uniref:Uncharacterized protein n=1 Tax=Dreissena polymorpha TaxID=45954 RepID=A0A9D4DL76_DREPO|nr:hypothetical protein DPMN_184598 [Dreissena polymorpha]
MYYTTCHFKAMLLRRKKNNSEEYFLSIAYGTLEGLKEHLRHRGNANLAGAGGISLLHKAVEEGNIQKVSLLINYNCNVSISDKEGNTPLHNAIRIGSLQEQKL